MISQNIIDTLTENLATGLSLQSYDHPRLAEIAQNELHNLILDITRYPSKYFPSEILETAKTTAKNPWKKRWKLQELHTISSISKRGKPNIPLKA